jgi:hypothetical protein
MHLAIPVLKRDEPLVREVALVESVVHWAAMTERPQGLMTLVDHAPCGAGPCSHPDETTNDEAPPLPLPEQQSAQTPPNVCIEKLEGAHHDGLDNVAQIVHDLGGQADPRKLARVAKAYENATVRRLGYLLERFGHKRRAAALLQFARKAKSLKPLHPRVRLVPSLARGIKHPEATAWKLSLNVPVEIDDE